MQMTIDFATAVESSSVVSSEGAAIRVERHKLSKVGKEALSGVKRSIDDKFREFDEANPHIYKAFVRLAFEALGKGKSRISADMLCHVLRWSLMMNTNDTDYRINNNWSSRLARKAIAENPEFANLFELRTLHS